MVIALSAAVLARLSAVEADAGIPVIDQVHQAVEVWSHLTGDERRMLGVMAMKLVIARHAGVRA